MRKIDCFGFLAFFVSGVPVPGVYLRDEQPVDFRRTIVVHTRLAGHTARVKAARTGQNGLQILTMGQLAARLAGGFLQPIDPDRHLRDAVREALVTVDLGELEPIKNLPGMLRAAVGTLDKLWRADIDLAGETHPRLQAIRTLEAEVLRRLPPSMKRPKELVDLASARIGYSQNPSSGRLKFMAIAKCRRAGGPFSAH